MILKVDRRKICILLCLCAWGILLFGCATVPTSLLQQGLGYTKEDIVQLQQTPEPGVALSPKVAMVLNTMRMGLDIINYGLGQHELTIDTLGVMDIASFDKQIQAERVSRLSLSVEDGSAIELYLCDPRSSAQAASNTDTNSTIPVILFLHGGGFVSGSYASYSQTIRNLAVETRSLVVAPMYRLAPEFPYPAAVNDVFLAYQWVQEHAASYGGDVQRLFVVGDSAGGNLAEVVTLQAHDYGIDMPRGVVMIYPALDLRDMPYLSREYYTGNFGGFYILQRSVLSSMVAAYLPNGQVEDPYASPLLAELPESHPPVLLIAAEIDPLRDDTYYMDIKLQRAGIPVETHIFAGMPHGFLGLSMLYKEAQEGFQLIQDFVGRVSGTP